MSNERLIRIIIFIFAAALHLAAIFFIVFDTSILRQEQSESARVMRLTDLEEETPPPPPPPPEQEIPVVEEIAEVMIETDIPPVQEVVAAGTLTTPPVVVTAAAVVVPVVEEEEIFLAAHQVSTPPHFDAAAIAADLVFPPIALRAGIEGRVILELFVDRTGTVQRIIILREDPPDRGFGEAAIRAFTGRKGTPATANGEPVSARYRYPVTFRIR